LEDILFDSETLMEVILGLFLYIRLMSVDQGGVRIVNKFGPGHVL
jgi:hypothetical protein